ncbi:hypothetical protein EVAR_51896_1 [Eumeta japonica]|uniref:Uncharacterized protein n=1 Tax=Eumeta variegata TaxID=151549 RepID=A0A4C1XHT0_EUMVA|nr:hypothetical protein EVAR_51896_1 [Eumeta japonica]
MYLPFRNLLSVTPRQRAVGRVGHASLGLLADLFVDAMTTRDRRLNTASPQPAEVAAGRCRDPLAPRARSPRDIFTATLVRVDRPAPPPYNHRPFPFSIPITMPDPIRTRSVAYPVLLMNISFDVLLVPIEGQNSFLNSLVVGNEFEDISTEPARRRKYIEELKYNIQGSNTHSANLGAMAQYGPIRRDPYYDAQNPPRYQRSIFI